jgi:hypothetical protein
MRRFDWMFALLVLLPADLPAAERDLHAYWDGRCKHCHGHAATFARQTLHVSDGKLAGRHHGAGELERFLANHYLADEWVAPVMAMLLAQATSAPTFAEKCGGCHGSAAAFARKSLLMNAGVLTGRTSHQPVKDDLARHGGLAPAEIAPMVQTLARVLGEVTPEKK